MNVELSDEVRNRICEDLLKLDGTPSMTPTLGRLYALLKGYDTPEPDYPEQPEAPAKQHPEHGARPMPEQGCDCRKANQATRLRDAALQAIDRFDANERHPSDNGWMWKACAWAMADDLRRAV